MTVPTFDRSTAANNDDTRTLYCPACSTDMPVADFREGRQDFTSSAFAASRAVSPTGTEAAF